MPWLKICPFSIVVFVGTATAFVMMEERRRRARQAQKKSLPNQQHDNKDSSFPPCNVIFVLGAPGVGKGTQCQLLCERRPGFQHLSAGDLLRAERQSHSALGDEIQQCIDAGQLVRSEITCQLLEQAMRRTYTQHNTPEQQQQCFCFLIDGYPRSQGNVDAWNSTMQHHRTVAILDFVCPEDTLVGRLLERGKSSGRADDNLATVQKRFVTFRTETAPIVEWYRTATAIPVRTIATDKPVEDVYQATVQVVDEVLVSLDTTSSEQQQTS